ERCILRKEHEGFQQKVIELCRFIRDVTTRAQLFMNYYIIKNRNLTVQEYIYEQNFWYCICKLVLGQKITNKAYINHTVALTFDDVATDDPSIISPFKDQKIKGYSDAMAAACESIATTYMNHMVENFTKRIRYYLYWALKPTFQVKCLTYIFIEKILIAQFIVK
ncbi:hypothetical protein BDF20DRAFT_826035, partial [Mycotypha africana]|uniref:uncharacterized protein n=1 Tax=Mycotypha africana TaxID=64632 RepID=UPI002300AC64